MRNYIKAELYRSFNRKYYKNFVIIISLLSIFLNLLFAAPDSVNYGDIFISLFVLLPLGLYFIILIVDIVIMEEFKNNTMKNIISSGLSRDKIVVGKIIVTIILSVIALFIILLSYLLSGYFILEKIPSIEIKNNLIALKNILVGAIPMWIACISIMTFFALNIKSTVGAIIGYYIAISSVPKLLDLLSHLFKIETLSVISSKLGVVNVVKTIVESTTINWSAVIIGIVYTFVFTVLSVVTFKKRDI